MRPPVFPKSSPPEIWSPTTPDQRRFWTAWRLYPDRATDCTCFRVRWAIDLDVARFERALEQVVARSDSLRLVFSEVGGQVLQRADPTIKADLAFGDFAIERQPTEAAVQWLDTVRYRPIDLEKRPFTTSLARVGDADWIWQITQNHTISDFQSTCLLLTRLSDIYQELATSASTQVQSYPSFVSYLESTPETLATTTSKDRATARSPADICPVLERGKRKTMSGSTRMLRHTITLDSTWIDRAQSALSLPHSGMDATFRKRLFDYVLTATAALCARLAGQGDVSLGLPMHNRHDPRAKEVSGLFMRVLPVPLQMNHDAPFSELRRETVAQTKRVMQAARAGTPIPAHPFSVVLNYLTTPPPDFAGCQSTELDQSTAAHAVGLDLSLRVIMGRDDHIRIAFDVNEDLSKVLRGADIAAAFQQCLDAALFSPSVLLRDLSLTPESARAAAMAKTAQAHRDATPPYDSFVQEFLAQAKAAPSAIALSEPGRKMSYGALDHASKSLALWLRQQNVGYGATVALALPRSVDLIIAMLGVLRAGAAYCVIDQDLPADRISVLLESLSPALILGKLDRAIRTVAPVYPDITPLHQQRAQKPGALPQIKPTWPMYVMFSSGTTGAPKGVTVPHGSFARYLSWAHDKAGSRRPLHWALASTAAFETAHRPFLALVSLGTIYIYPAGIGGSGQSLMDAVADDRAEFLCLTPSHLRLLARRNHPVTNLKTLVVIGEKLSTPLARHAHAAFNGQVELQNWYGPTETVMATAMHRFAPDTDLGATVPLGHAAPGSVVHVLDDAMNPVPPGVLGHIHIGGARMSLGYLNRPDLTQRAFIADPFHPGGRLFRTGDIGWIDQNAQLVFHNRADDRLKLQGVWESLSNIQRAVASHPKVQDSTVIDIGTEAPVLVCFYTAAHSLPAADLRAETAKYIARNAVPARFHQLEALPLTINGKIDRSALEQLSGQLLQLPDVGLKPELTTSLPEAKLSALWVDVLKTDTITRFDDFFDLGGDSLSMVEMVLRVEELFNLRIAAHELAQVTTIAQTLVLIEKRSSAGHQNPATDSTQSEALTEIARRMTLAASHWAGEHVGRDLPIQRFNATGTKPALFWCFNGAFEPEKMAQAIDADQPILAMRSLNGIIEDRAEKRRAAVDIARLYTDEIQRLQPDGPYSIGGNCQAGLIAELIARELTVRGQTVARLILLEHTPAQPYADPLALFYGAQSKEYNPFLSIKTPEIMWKHMHKDVVWDVIPGNHGTYFHPENLPKFMERLHHRLK